MIPDIIAAHEPNDAPTVICQARDFLLKGEWVNWFFYVGEWEALITLQLKYFDEKYLRVCRLTWNDELIVIPNSAAQSRLRDLTHSDKRWRALTSALGDSPSCALLSTRSGRDSMIVKIINFSVFLSSIILPANCSLLNFCSKPQIHWGFLHELLYKGC